MINRSPQRACWTALLVAALLCAPAAWAQPAAPALPGFAELEAAGAKIGRIRVVTNNVFDIEDPREDHAAFRWANRLHVPTRPAVIESALLFRSGDPVSVRLIDETERLLRSQRTLNDVHFRVLAVNEGVVDIEVSTRDSWSLEPTLGIASAGGATTTAIGLREHNLLGTGIALGIGHRSSVDRAGNEFQLQYDRAFDGWTSLAYTHATNSDGRIDAVSVVRPFYALDARRAGGLSASDEERIDAIYNAGHVIGQYRHHQQLGEVFGGWSAGLVDGWVRRYSIGLAVRDDAFALAPALAPPPQLPVSEKLHMPFVRYELIADRFEKEVNRNLVGRPEFFALGLHSKLQLGWAATSLGSTQDALVYDATIGRGFEPQPGRTLLLSAQLSGRFSDGQVRRQRLGMQAQSFWSQSPRWLFYAGLAADALTRPQPQDALLLGGDNGLRGYPLRFQSGNRRVLMTLEERTYTDLYVWRLFRVGGAAFFDVGRAWGGDNVNRQAPGWLSNVGAGLRIVSARSAFGNVLHVDLAFPLGAPAGINKVQFGVKTRFSF